jgi:acetyl-CoA acyltransferase
MSDVYIVESVRTPGCRRKKGAFADTRPESLLSHILDALMEKSGVDKKLVEDIMIGCAFPEAEQGLNIGRIAALMAGFPIETSGATINRFCSSGLEAIALSGMRIMAGWSDVAIGGGIESMTFVPMGGNMPRPHPGWAAEDPDVYISMGITAENVANRNEITREMQDEFAFHSQMKAANAQKNGHFTEIIPTPAVKHVQKDGRWVKETFMQDFDDGVRDNTTIEGLAKLRPAFSSTGSVTAGNSSQTTDGAAATLLMSEKAVKETGAKPIAKLKTYTTIGVEADEMGVGPAYAIPKALKMADLKIDDIGLFEVNEAFASQAIYSANQVGIGDKKFWTHDSKDCKININGGAIALGHPLGCTGAKLAATLLANMKRLGVKYGLESMCIGGGMGAAAIFELVD